MWSNKTGGREAGEIRGRLFISLYKKSLKKVVEKVASMENSSYL